MPNASSTSSSSSPVGASPFGALGGSAAGVGFELARGGLISAKMSSHCALFYAFTSSHIKDVSAVKSAKSSFLAIVATLVWRRPIFTSCFSDIIAVTLAQMVGD
jgi:hypothetical protein